VKCLYCFLSDMIFPQRKTRRRGEKETKLNKPQGGDL
jgi:DNA repair photolyase